MNIDQLNQNYPGLEYLTEPLSESKDYSLTTDGFTAEIAIKSTGDILKLSKDHLTNLNDSKKFIKRGFHFIDHCGFQFGKYGEISITFFHPKFNYIDEAQEWYANPLKFKIGNKLFSIGPASPLFVFISEPFYRDSDFQYDFQNFTTIKVTNTTLVTIKDDIIKAIYFLNSYYLKKIGYVSRIYQMNIDYDAIELWNTDESEKFKKLNRVRIRERYDFLSLEPLKLYNHSQLLNGDEKFLFLYRIIEFFMNRARIKKLNELRSDKTVTDIQLLMTIDKKNEEMLLDNLLIMSLNTNQRKRLSSYAFHCKLIPSNNYQLLPKALYKYRNSIVHAKEQQITETKIPDPFSQNTETYSWTYIVDDIALKCIIKYNKNEILLP
jgi:hypothetical protein